LELDKQDILEQFSARDGAVWVKRLITPTQSQKIAGLMDQGKLPGIKLRQEFGRNYPERTLAAQLTGYVGIDNKGLEGIEHSLQDVLEPPAEQGRREDLYGNQVFLTIDIAAQHAMEQLALDAYTVNDADSVILLVMEAKTGEILSYVSLPNYDPNHYGSYPDAALTNRPLREAYEPGSVFKVFSIASFLEIGGISTHDTFFCDGTYEYSQQGQPIRDLRAHGEVDAQRILKFSCNVGAAYASETVSETEFYEMLRRFDFGIPSGVELAGENPGVLRKPGSWSIRSKPTIAFGQEISATALQITKAATALTNKGLLLEPRVVKKIVSPGGRLIEEYERSPLRQVLSPEVAEEVLLMMETATEAGGTARAARIEGIRVSGKTGTAEIFDSSAGTYSQDSVVASFLGVFPTDDPQIILYVAINNPKKERYYGSQIAAPVFKNAAERLADLFNIPRRDSAVVTHSGRIVISPVEEISLGEKMPDLKGTPKRSLLPLYEREDLTIVIKGEGYVVKQSPSPGTQLESGMSLILELQ
jgi:cell division protein FtsI (penicillin-binding protein 3)